MGHNEIRHRLSEYIDGSVTVEEKAEIDAHLQTCSVCNDAFLELQKTIVHMQTIEDMEPQLDNKENHGKDPFRKD